MASREVPEIGKRHKLVQVGLGDFGQRWFHTVLQNGSWEYVGLASRNQAVVSRCAEEAGLSRRHCHAGLEEALALHGDAEAVLVTTPHFRHEEDISTALRHGCHVIVEKPLAGSLPEVLRIAAEARASTKSVMVAENYRFGHGPRLIRKLLEEGRIGKPELITIQYFVHHQFPSDDWRNSYEFPVLVENSTHHFDLLRYVTGKDISEVWCTASGSQRTNPWPFPTVSVNVSLHGGARAQYTASWTYGEFETPWEGEWRIYGTDGAIQWGRDHIRIAKDGSIRDHPVPSKDSDHTIADTLAEFTNALDEQRRPEVDIDDNLQTLAVVFGAIESSRLRQPIRIADIIP